MEIENCPVCSRELVLLLDGENKYYGKICSETKEHIFRLIDINDNKLDLIIYLNIIINDSQMFITWYANNHFSIDDLTNMDDESSPSFNSIIRLPFWEPDFSNYPKLLEKIKTILVMS